MIPTATLNGTTFTEAQVANLVQQIEAAKKPQTGVLRRYHRATE